jgi:hypothetical protein
MPKTRSVYPHKRGYGLQDLPIGQPIPDTRLTVVAYVWRPAQGGAYGRTEVRCRCACGVEFITRPDSIRRGRTRSCGCLRAELVALHKADIIRWGGRRKQQRRERI